MDIGSAFTYMFDDQEWLKKIAIGGGIVLVAIILSPILIGLALLLPINGYMFETLKNVRDGRPTPLPEWSNFGDLFMKGLMIFVIGLVYTLPSLLFACGSFVTNPQMIVAVAPDVDQDVVASLGILSGCLSCIQFILSLAGSALVPAGIIRYAQFGTLSSAFEFGAIFNFIKNNIGDYIIVFLLSMVSNLVAALGIILCVIGVVFTGFWGVLVNANLYGQLARKANL